MQRRLPSPGLQVEVVILDFDAPIPKKKTAEGAATQPAATAKDSSAPIPQESAGPVDGSQPADQPAGDVDELKGKDPKYMFLYHVLVLLSADHILVKGYLQESLHELVVFINSELIRLFLQGVLHRKQMLMNKGNPRWLLLWRRARVINR